MGVPAIILTPSHPPPSGFSGVRFAPVLRSISLKQVPSKKPNELRRSFQLAPPSAPFKSLTQSRRKAKGEWLKGFQLSAIGYQFLYFVNFVSVVRSSQSVVLRIMVYQLYVVCFFLVLIFKLLNIRFLFSQNQADFYHTNDRL